MSNSDIDHHIESRYNALYQNAEEIKQRRSIERRRKLQEELKDCTFHPQRVTDSNLPKVTGRPHSQGQKIDVISSLERLYPAKDRLSKRQEL